MSIDLADWLLSVRSWDAARSAASTALDWHLKCPTDTR